jgi:hypothetical protein
VSDLRSARDVRDAFLDANDLASPLQQQDITPLSLVRTEFHLGFFLSHADQAKAAPVVEPEADLVL